MRVTKTSNYSPSMGMKYSQKKYVYGLFSKVKDNIDLENGKKIHIVTSYYDNKPLNKLIYLRDKLGEWVKSKLIYYKTNGKKLVTKRSERSSK